MALFEYKVINPDGASEEGVFEANEKSDAAKFLINQGLRIIHLEEKRKGEFERFKRKLLTRPLSDKKVALLFRQLAILIDPESTHQALKLLEDESKDKELKSVIKDLREQVENGYPLYKSLSRHAESISSSVISLVQAGEESGNLKEILGRIADYLEKMADAKEKFQTACIYPVLLLSVTFGLMAIMFTFVIPTFAALFQSLNAELPLPTLIVLKIGNFVNDNGITLFLTLILISLMFMYFLQYEWFKIKIDTFLLRLPFVGDFIRHSAWSNIFITLEMLIKGGFQLNQALLMAENTSGNLVFKNFLRRAAKSLTEGHSLKTTFRNFKDIPSAHLGLIIAGESSGRLEEALLKGAEFSNKEVAYILKRAEAMISPVLTLIVGGVVLFFVLSVVLPMFNFTELI